MIARLGMLAALLGLGLGCATSRSDWPLEQAEKHRSEGRLDSALQLTEQQLQDRYEDPGPALVALHIDILRAMNRAVEADAFREFADRYHSGVDTYAVPAEPSWNDCMKSQPGSDLIFSWGDKFKPVVVPYSLGSLVATFQIDAEGSIGAIRVVRARYPAAAWLVIRAIGTSKVSQTRVADRRESDPGSLPLTLCVWQTYAANPVTPSSVPEMYEIRDFAR